METPATSLSHAKRRILELLKRRENTLTSELARTLGLTEVAVRQHLTTLSRIGLVEGGPAAPSGRGRPALRWTLTPLAQGIFPERHAELAVSLIEGTRKLFGDEGLQKLIDERAREQRRQYQERIPSDRPLGERVAALARERTQEGYMAEVVAEEDGSYLLVEHHCPICDAAQSCLGLCRAELSVFRRTLGPAVEVERESHLLSGDLRCVYRIRPRSSSSR